MRIIYSIFAMISCIVAIAQSPITIGNSNMPSANDTLRYTNVNLAGIGNYTATGVNHTWNFSNVISTTEGLRSYKIALTTPYAFFFPSFSGSAEKMPDVIVGGNFGFTDYYNFYKKQTSPTNAYVADGVGMTFSSIPLPAYYIDKDELYVFPLTYPKYDSTTFKFSTPVNSNIPKYTKVGSRVTKVDGWGTITTPYGVENCLRVVTTQFAMDSIKYAPIPFPVGFPNNQRSYQWLTLNSKIPYFEVSGSLIAGNFVPNQARYRGYPKETVNPNPVGITTIAQVPKFLIMPNPANNEITIDNLPGKAVLRVYDMNGRLVLNKITGSEAAPERFDLTALSPGIYCIKVFTENAVDHLKFVKE